MSTIDPQLVLAGVQAIRLISEQIDLYSRGELSDEQLATKWAEMGVRVDLANRLWEEGGTEA